MQNAETQVVPLQQHQKVLAENADLKARIAWFERQMFGKKSERFVPADSGQLSLEFDAEHTARVAEAAKQVVAAHERTKTPAETKHQGRLPIPADLPRVEEVIEPQEDVSGMVRIGEDVSEVIEYEAGRIWVRRTVRPRYARPAAQQAAADAAGDSTPAIVQAPMPDCAFPKLKAGLSLLAHILISKYVDHLPLYRIRQQFIRQNIQIPESSISEWVKVTADHLLALYKMFEILIFTSNYLQMDETKLRVLEEGKGKCHLGYIWAVWDPVKKLPFFFYQTGRDHNGPKKLLEHFAGHLQCDGYRVYETLDRNLANIQLVNCLAHIRREFFNARDNDAARADTALAFIKSLYAIEEKARVGEFTHQQRLELRQSEAAPLFKSMGDWMTIQYDEVTPSSTIGKALYYARNRWPNMEPYLHDGKIEIDNNPVENIIRPIAIGRKNYLFAGSHEAAQRSAMLYTFFAACKHHNINPQEWLSDVLGRIYKLNTAELIDLLPHNWKPKSTNPA